MQDKLSVTFGGIPYLGLSSVDEGFFGSRAFRKSYGLQSFSRRGALLNLGMCGDFLRVVARALGIQISFALFTVAPQKKKKHPGAIPFFACGI